MADYSWREMGVRNDIGQNSSDSSGESEDNIDDITANATGDVEIENKFNDFTHYWADEETKDEHRMSGDTPDVRIYISRQVLPETIEESLPNEEGESYIRRGEDQDYNVNNTAVFRDENGKYVYGHKELDDEWVKEAMTALKKYITHHGVTDDVTFG